jgi:hypothetical protein
VRKFRFTNSEWRGLTNGKAPRYVRRATRDAADPATLIDTGVEIPSRLFVVSLRIVVPQFERCDLE